MKVFSKFFLPLVFLCISFVAFAQTDSSVTTHANNNFQSPHTNFYTAAADTNLKGNGIKRFLVGKNYRREWTQPVTVPILNFKTEAGGLTPDKEGGGKETQGLHVTDSLGREYSLRSVKKYPERALPPEFLHTAEESLFKDGISASYPYAVLSMGVFSNAVGVPYLRNKLVYVTDDPALGKFRSKFKDALYFLEERFPNSISSGTTEEDNEKSLSTEKLFYKLQKNNDSKVNQLAILRARLLDNYVMDFDRHEGQWTWYSKDSAGEKIYYPIPKDRDQVFFVNQGFLTKFISGKSLFPQLQGFRARPKDIVSFNQTARNFDNYFLNELSEKQWSELTDEFLHQMTDSVIVSALLQQPEEIQQYSTPKIISALEHKRGNFKYDIMKYYRALAKTVTIIGTNEREQFNIKTNDDETVLVTVYKIDSAGNSSSIIYQRLFDPNVTKEIRLFGLEGDDRFIAEGGKSKIKIRMIGGPGNDTFINNGKKGKLLAYDVNTEDNTVKGMRNKISSDPLNNLYFRQFYTPNVSSVSPAIQLGSEEGVFLGLQFSAKTQGFRKEPYAMLQKISVTHSLIYPSFRVKYDADFVNALGKKTDLLIHSDVITPTVRTNFFGYGNNTTIALPDKNNIDYYHAHYDIGSFSLLAQRKFGSVFQVQYGGTFQYLDLRLRQNETTYVTQVMPPNASDAYHKKYYAGGELNLLLDLRNNPILPARGIVIKTYTKALAGLNSYSHNNTQTGGDFIFYTDFLYKDHIIIASDFGGGHNFGHFEIGQAQYLGFTTNLRGYRALRFAGRSAAYNNTELRIRLADVNLYLAPITFGILGFNDVGRVWADGEISSQWHDGYGGGIWAALENRIVATGTLAFSKEEKILPSVKIGFEF